jgi:hypothetical protein
MSLLWLILLDRHSPLDGALRGLYTKRPVFAPLRIASREMLFSDRYKSLTEERHDEPEKHVSTSSTTERELLEVRTPRYLKANKVEKKNAG